MTKNKTTRQNRFLFQATNSHGKTFDIVGFEIIFGMNEKGYDMQKVLQEFQSCIGAELAGKYVGEVTKEGMATRAVMATVTQLKSNKYAFKKIGDENSDTIIYKIFKLDASRSNGKLDGEMIPFAHITYKKSLNLIETDNREIDQMLSNNYRWFVLNYTNADVMRYIKTMFERETTCISLRKQGGAYFVPAKDHELIQKARSFFDAIDPNGDFHVTELPDLDGVKEATASAYERKIQDVKDEIASRLDKMKNDGKDMTKTIRKNLFEEVVALGKELELMMDITEYDMMTGKDTLTEINSMISDYTLDTGDKE